VYRTTFYKEHLYRILWSSGARFSRRHSGFIRIRSPYQALCYFVKNVSTNYARLEVLSVLLISWSVGVTAVWLAVYLRTFRKIAVWKCLTLKIATRHSMTIFLIHCTVFRGKVAQTVQRLVTGWTVRGSNSGGVEFFRTRPDRSWGPPSLLCNG